MKSGLRLDVTHPRPCFSSARLFTKLVLEAPIITESALDVIRRYCEDEVSDAASSVPLQQPSFPLLT